MPNDTTTLNGALQELGETLASNLESMGVSASASDGLTTLANAILDIEQGGGGQEIVSFDNLTTDFNYTKKRGNYGFSVTIPNGVQRLTDECFYSCRGMTNVSIPNGVTSFGTRCFYDCNGLTSINIPNTVTSLGQYCFYNCSALSSVNIPNSVTAIPNNCFQTCSNLTNISIPNTVTKIGDYAFHKCAKLTNVIIPNGVTNLGYACFLDCTSLTSMNIPNTVTTIKTNCFKGCSNITDYQLYWNTPPITWNSNYMPNNTNTIFTIPNGTTANYVAKSFPSAKLVERSG